MSTLTRCTPSWWLMRGLIGCIWMTLTSPNSLRHHVKESFDVFSQRASSAWQGMQPQRLTVSLLLPCMNSEADEWLDFMQCQRQFWPTMTTRHASLAPIELGTFRRERRLMQSKHLGTPSALTGISWTRSCTMPNLLATLENFYGTTSLSRSTVKIHFRNVSIRVMMRRMYTTSGMLIGAT